MDIYQRLFIIGIVLAVVSFFAMVAKKIDFQKSDKPIKIELSAFIFGLILIFVGILFSKSLIN